jgi:hypothetical protein
VSKQSRRARPGTRPVGDAGATGPASNPTGPGGTRPSSTAGPAGTRPSGTSSGSGVTPSRPTSTRVGRRERARPGPSKSFAERYRAPIIGLVAVAAVALIGVFAFNSAGAAAYACSVEFQAAPTASPSAGTAPQPGYPQDDMGNAHVAPGSEVTYTFCPPATGSHYNVGAPIAPRVYGPGDRTIPQGWIHNLEHGSLVILYRGREGDEGVTEAAQGALTNFYNDMPSSPVCGFPPNQQGAGVVITRFDDMATPYAALVWGRVLPLQTFDQAAIMEFWNTFGERTNPEKFCAVPSPGSSGPPAASPAAS